MDKQVTSTPQYLKIRGGVWLPVFTLLTTVDWEPAINVDMVNENTSEDTKLITRWRKIYEQY